MDGKTKAVNLYEEILLNKELKDKMEKLFNAFLDIGIVDKIKKIIEKQADEEKLKDKIEKLTNGITDKEELTDVLNNMTYELVNSTKMADALEKLHNELKDNKELMNKIKDFMETKEIKTILKNDGF